MYKVRQFDIFQQQKIITIENSHACGAEIGAEICPIVPGGFKIVGSMGMESLHNHRSFLALQIHCRRMGSRKFRFR